MKLNFVSFNDKKVIVGTSQVYTKDNKWKREYLPQRYDKYSTLHHMRNDAIHLGVALPSKEAPDEVFNGIICFDLDVRGNDKADVFDEVLDFFEDRDLLFSENVETKGESMHIWVRIDPEIQREIVKGVRNIRTSAKLTVTNDSSIDLIFGSKCIRTSFPGKEGYQCMSGRILFENLPYMEFDDILKLIDNETETFENIMFYIDHSEPINDSNIDNSNLEFKADKEEFLRRYLNIDRLNEKDSYTELAGAIVKLTLAERLYNIELLDIYLALLICSKKSDSGLIRTYEKIYREDHLQYTKELVSYCIKIHDEVAGIELDYNNIF